jgi:hypothetical protein
MAGVLALLKHLGQDEYLGMVRLGKCRPGSKWQSTSKPPKHSASPGDAARHRGRVDSIASKGCSRGSPITVRAIGRLDYCDARATSVLGHRRSCQPNGHHGRISPESRRRKPRRSARTKRNTPPRRAACCIPKSCACVTARSSRTGRRRRWRRGRAACSRATCAMRSGSAGRPCRRCLRGRCGRAWRCRNCCSSSCCR